METDPAAIHQALIHIGNPLAAVDAGGIPGVCRAGCIMSGCITSGCITSGYNTSGPAEQPKINQPETTQPETNQPKANQPETTPPEADDPGGRLPLLSVMPALVPEQLGNPIFKKKYHLRYACVAGAMAHGIASARLVRAAADAGMIGFFGAAGLSPANLEAAIHQVQSHAGPDQPYGFNLVYGGNADLEAAMVNLYLTHKVRTVSAAGYLKLTPSLLRFRLHGIYRTPDGKVVCPNKIIAKTSRLEIASWFLSPPPEKLVARLRDQHLITAEEAALARHVPVAEDLSAEADSGGHTDNRAALALLPSIIDLRNRLFEKYHYGALPCIGLGGGVATPLSAAAAFALGADYVLTGSVNQACTESGTSRAVREMLADASQTDVTMAPSANLFERGIKVQVLKKGTLFARRAARLFDIYQRFDGLDQIPESMKNELETMIFQNSLEKEWQGCCSFFNAYDPAQLDAAKSNPKRKMALLFRSYLGKSAKWAICGDPDRVKDYQIWCGPSMGAFNEWAQGSFLEIPENRKFKTIAMNLLTGACAELRRHRLATDLAAADMCLPPHAGRFTPLSMAEIQIILSPAQL